MHVVRQMSAAAYSYYAVASSMGGERGRCRALSIRLAPLLRDLAWRCLLCLCCFGPHRSTNVHILLTHICMQLPTAAIAMRNGTSTQPPLLPMDASADIPGKLRRCIIVHPRFGLGHPIAALYLAAVTCMAFWSLGAICSPCPEPTPP